MLAGEITGGIAGGLSGNFVNKSVNFLDVQRGLLRKNPVGYFLDLNAPGILLGTLLTKSAIEYFLGPPKTQ